MKKRELAAVIALLSVVSSTCIEGMKAIGRKLERKDVSFEDISPDPESVTENEAE